jgi:hypothetical protein
MNAVTTHIVTPEFLVGTPADVNYAANMYQWRSKQYMTGLQQGRLVHQPIDADFEFNWNNGCDELNNCSLVQKRAMEMQLRGS